MPRECTITVAGMAGAEEIAICQYSCGCHPFVAWHGVAAVNRFWFWDCLWPHGEQEAAVNRQVLAWCRQHPVAAGAAARGCVH